MVSIANQAHDLGSKAGLHAVARAQSRHEVTAETIRGADRVIRAPKDTGDGSVVVRQRRLNGHGLVFRHDVLPKTKASLHRAQVLSG